MLQFSGNIELKERRIGIVSVSFCAKKVHFNCHNWWSLLRLLGALRPFRGLGLVSMRLSLSEAVFSELFCRAVPQSGPVRGNFSGEPCCRAVPQWLCEWRL